MKPLLPQAPNFCPSPNRNFLARVLALILCDFFAAGLAFAEQAGQRQAAGKAVTLEPRAAQHTGRGRSGAAGLRATQTEQWAEVTVPDETLPKVAMTSTRSTFLATWPAVPGAAGYRLDVSRTRSFIDYVAGYHDLDVGQTTGRIVTGLSAGTGYFYRVRSYDPSGAAGTETMGAAATAVSSGLVIDPTFDSSITGDPSSAAIQAAINQAIALYQSLFSNPITVKIRYRYSNTAPDGTPLINGAVAQSIFVVYDLSWNTFVTVLNADAKTTNDTTANATLPPTVFTDFVVPSSAGGRALGFDTPPAMFADGTVAAGGPYDGIVTLNSDEPLDFTRPTASNSFDAREGVEHEMDEVLGLGSNIGVTTPETKLRPQDLFSWSSPGTRNVSAVGVRYFSIDGGNTNVVNFSQNPDGDFGDWLSAACPQLTPYVQNAFGCKGQSADIAASSPEGINLDVIGYDLGAAGPTPTPGPTTLGNVSTRLRVETGDDVLIGGFIVDGTQPKQVIVRAIGPSLPLAGVLADPILELHQGDAIIATNDNWRTDQETEILASGFVPATDKESAILTTLDPGSYTAIVRGVNSGMGIGLVEVYDLGQDSPSTLANISTRGLVQTGDNVLIGGFIVLGGDPTAVLIRALGPSLPLAFTLPDPTLELHDVNGRTVVSNDDWRSNQEPEISFTGLAPSDDAESALFAVLAPGNYTAIVRGKDEGTGIALVEVYQLGN
jgi:hypothetical protein